MFFFIRKPVLHLDLLNCQNGSFGFLNAGRESQQHETFVQTDA